MTNNENIDLAKLIAKVKQATIEQHSNQEFVPPEAKEKFMAAVKTYDMSREVERKILNDVVNKAYGGRPNNFRSIWDAISEDIAQVSLAICKGTTVYVPNVNFDPIKITKEQAYEAFVTSTPLSCIVNEYNDILAVLQSGRQIRWDDCNILPGPAAIGESICFDIWDEMTQYTVWINIEDKKATIITTTTWTRATDEMVQNLNAHCQLTPPEMLRIWVANISATLKVGDPIPAWFGEFLAKASL